MNAEDAWRYERKFVVEGMPSGEVESILLRRASFREIFHLRWVNNIYLDGPEMSSLLDNVNGLSERLKTRIRWYGDFFGHIERPTLERKLKQGLLGRKETYALEAFDLNPGFDAAEISRWCARSQLPDRVRVELRRRGSVLVNRYKRRYFQSADRRFRFTVDSGILYQAVRCFDNRLLQWRRHPDVVVELKYAASDDAESASITADLPFRLCRSSKYVGGLDAVHSLSIH